MVKKITIIILICVLMLINLYSYSPVTADTFFNNKEAEKVKNGDIITRMYLKYNAVGENTDLNIDVKKTKYADEDFSVYEMITDEKAFLKVNIDSENDKLKFYNTLIAYSKLKGMKYFSRRIQKVQELIVDSFRIESPKDKKNKLNDQRLTIIVPKLENYFLQEDNKFGKLVFKSELYNEGDNFILINTCVNPLSKSGINICKSNEYKVISYFIYDKNLKGFYYYSVYVMRIRIEMLLKKGGLGTLYPTTFSNRLRAGTVHLANLLGLNWGNKINPWDEDKLEDGFYKNY